MESSLRVNLFVGEGVPIGEDADRGSMAQSYACLRKKVQERIWYQKQGAFAFLVDAPLTFGHTQLVLRVVCRAEERLFSRSAPHIVECVRRLRTLLPGRLENWEHLATYTKTEGAYKKTLLLRVSADEQGDMYKIHLVPYFESHLKSTCRLYQETLGFSDGGIGGLLHWLGKTEVRRDRDMKPTREDSTVKTRVASLRLQDLARAMREGKCEIAASRRSHAGVVLM